MPKLYDALPVVIIPKAEKKTFRTANMLLHILSKNVLYTHTHTHTYIYIYIYIYIEDVSERIVNILGGGSMDYSA